MYITLTTKNPTNITVKTNNIVLLL